MPTEHIYLDDAYGKQCDSKAVMVEFTDLTVDRSIFFPTGEGQPNDRGYVEIDGKKYVIVDTWKDGVWVHLISLDTYPQDIAGKAVKQIIDWDTRYKHMRFRSAMYLLSSLAYREFGATTRINQTYDDQSWMDIYAEELTEEMVNRLKDDANEIVSRDLEIKNSYITAEEYRSNEELMGISKGNVPDHDRIRLCSIDDLPKQYDMGTQVAKTSEIGTINLKTSLVKGKLNKRVILTLS